MVDISENAPYTKEQGQQLRSMGFQVWSCYFCVVARYTKPCWPAQMVILKSGDSKVRCPVHLGEK